jgi:hypothetical protein
MTMASGTNPSRCPAIDLNGILRSILSESASTIQQPRPPSPVVSSRVASRRPEASRARASLPEATLIREKPVSRLTPSSDLRIMTS